MAVFAEIARGSDNDVETVDTSLDSDLGIFEMAAYVGEDLGFELARALEAIKNARSRDRLTPSLQIASQSRLDCSEAAGLVNSMSARVVSSATVQAKCRGAEPYSLHQSRRAPSRS
jgi:hypothetical protein